MAPQTRSEVAIAGAACVSVAPRSSSAAPSSEGLTPARWTYAPARLMRMDRLCALALVACDAALADAGAPALDGDATAVVFGTVYGCHATNEDYERSRAQGASPRLFAYTLPSSPTGEVAIHYRLRGPALTFASGATAPLDALDAARRLVADGRAARALVVAADVATPWLARVAPGAPARDVAAALVLERSGARVRGCLLGVTSAFRANDSASAAVLAESALSLRATATYLPDGAPLASLASWLASSASGTALVTARDPAGAAAAALIARGEA
jgi:3-oxoacyl-[acyl-carrier-protein] synthase II